MTLDRWLGVDPPGQGAVTVGVTRVAPHGEEELSAPEGDTDAIDRWSKEANDYLEDQRQAQKEKVKSLPF